MSISLDLALMAAKIRTLTGMLEKCAEEVEEIKRQVEAKDRLSTLDFWTTPGPSESTVRDKLAAVSEI
jgi:hypothetical protein